MATLAGEGSLVDKLSFAEQTLVYAIRRTEEDEMSASFKHNTVTLFLPKRMIAAFIDTDKVGFEHHDGPLHLLVEKDFTCLEKVAEDQSDNYPNPLAVKKDE